MFFSFEGFNSSLHWGGPYKPIYINNMHEDGQTASAVYVSGGHEDMKMDRQHQLYMSQVHRGYVDGSLLKHNL